MYKIYRGRIRSIDTIKIKDNITTYTVGNATDSMGGKTENKIFYAIQHSYGMGEPDSMDGVLRKGVPVFFIADSSGSGGAILCTIQESPGSKLEPKASLKDNISTLFQSNDKPPTTPGDFLWSKFSALVLFAYSGLIKLRAKLGLEIILNPVLERLDVLGKKIRINFGGLEQNILEFGFQDESQGQVNINLGFITDTTGTDKESSVMGLKVGRMKEPANRVLFSIMDYTTKEIKTKILIDKDGNIELKGKSIKMSLNDKSQVEIDETGKAYVKTEEFYLGRGTTDQPFIRGKEFAKNYLNLLKLLKYHRHLSNGSPSPELQHIHETQALQESKELSKTNKLD